VEEDLSDWTFDINFGRLYRGICAERLIFCRKKKLKLALKVWS
jgi:hypothetical protein